MLKLNNKIFLLGTIILSLSLSSAVSASRSTSAPTQSSASSNGRLSTLRFHDPISHSMKFELDEDGSIFQDNELKNADSDIDFGHYRRNSFTVGIKNSIEDGSRGAILDLGSEKDLQREFGFYETLGGGQGFASLRLEGRNLFILKDYRARTTQVLGSIYRLLDDPAELSSAPVLLGHIYIVRLTDVDDPSYEKIVKFKVVEYTPEESVTIRG